MKLQPGLSCFSEPMSDLPIFQGVFEHIGRLLTLNLKSDARLEMKKSLGTLLTNVVVRKSSNISQELCRLASGSPKRFTNQTFIKLMQI